MTLDGEHRIQYTDDILQNCTLEIYMILLTKVTSNKFKVFFLIIGKSPK